MKASSFFYKAARLTRDAEALEKSVETGDPTYVGRRARNVLVGRALGRAGLWRLLWGGRR